MNPTVRIMIFDADRGRGARLAALLEVQDFKATHHEQANLAVELLRRERPDLVLVFEAGATEPGGFPRLRESSQGMKIPTLAVVEDAADLEGLVDGFDDWVRLGSVEVELPNRIRRLLAQPPDLKVPAIDPRFLALVVHDLRTPLNVITLTIRAVGQSVPNPSPEFEEDLTFLFENAKQIEKMLAQLGDYCRLVESERQPSAVEFQTRRFLSDFLEEKQSKRDSEFKSVRLEFAPDSPEEVALDPNRVRLAIGHALANAVVAAGDAPIRLRSKGPAGRWTIELVVEKPPPPTISSTKLQPHLFERLIGSAAERRGLDLAIASRVSELFGGSARLDVEPGIRSMIVLEWPARLPS